MLEEIPPYRRTQGAHQWRELSLRPQQRRGHRLVRVALGALIGAILGLLIGTLVLSDPLDMPGREELYMLSDLAFHALWVLLGVIAGVLVGVARTALERR